MKLAVTTILLVVLVVAVQSAPQHFNLGGMTGVVDAISSVNGETGNADPKMVSKAEEVLKSLITKHLINKKAIKKAARELQKAQEENKAKAPEPTVNEPKVNEEFMKNLKAINWDEHPDQREMINKKVPGGTEAVDALVKLLKEPKEPAALEQPQN